MKAKTLLLTTLVLALIITGCTKNTVETTNEIEIFGIYTKEELVKDADRLIKITQAYSPKLYTDEEELQEEYQKAIVKLKDDMTALDFIQIMKPVVAALRCGHTHIYANFDWNNIKIIPLDIKVIDGRLYLINSAGDTKIPAGSEIKEINGKPADEIIEVIMKGTSADGYNETGKLKFISRLFAREYLLNIEYADSFSIRYISPDEKQSIDTVSAMKIDRVRNKLWQSYNKLYDSEFEDNYAVLTVHSFNPNSRNTIGNFNEFFDKFFLEVKEKDIENVILDIRGNSGGDPLITSHLFSYLETGPHPYFAPESPNYYSGLKDPIPMAENNFGGNLYILADGGCFSSATHLLALLDYQNRGVIIGEETGGSYICTDSSKDQTLPETELNFHYSTQAWSVDVEGFTGGRGIMPDHEIKLKLDDYLNNTDPIMQYTLDLIN